jgi:hypothetical protein
MDEYQFPVALAFNTITAKNFPDRVTLIQGMGFVRRVKPGTKIFCVMGHVITSGM